MNRIVHFDIMADKPERAAKFYNKVFGWKFDKWEGGNMDYWIAMTGKKNEPGINGGLAKREKDYKGQLWFQNTIEVDSVDEYLRKVKEKGGKILSPKMAIQGVGWFAKCQDTEGNEFGIMQTDKKAM